MGLSQALGCFTDWCPLVLVCSKARSATNEPPPTSSEALLYQGRRSCVE